MLSFLFSVLKISLILIVLVFIISFIQSFFPPERVRKILQNFHGPVANLVAALLGTVTPFCSCSSIPIFMGFTKAGLPIGVTFSFLISSPMVDLSSLILLMSIFGWKVSVIYVGLGLCVAVTGGTIIEKLKMQNQLEDLNKPEEKKVVFKPVVKENESVNSLNGKAVLKKSTQEKKCCCGNSTNDENGKMEFKERIILSLKSVWQTYRKVVLYIVIGCAIGSVIHDWVPKEWIVSVLGKSNPFGVVIASVLGAPLYADIFGVIPVVESLLKKGALLGVVISFMMGVITLSVPSLVMLSKAVKPKLLALFVGICMAGIIITGYVFNFIQPVIL